MKNKDLLIKIIISGVFLIFIIFGLLSGDAQKVLNKAIKICLECIGIG